MSERLVPAPAEQTLLEAQVVSPPGSGSAAARPPAAGRRHLDAVDVVRVVMIAGVVSVHTVRYTTNPNDTLAGAVTGLLHLNREVFFFLTAFVLTYAYGARRGWSVWQFWARRYKLVVPPYLAWSVIYLVADPGSHFPLLHELHRLAAAIATGGARYHLYFLLVTMQIYAVYPLLLWLLRATRRHHVVLVAASFALQTALTATMHYGGPQTGLLGSWFAHPDPWLASYQFYVVAGGVAALHFEELTTWVRGHAGTVGALVFATLVLDLANYLVDTRWLGQLPSKAGEVFQPVVAVTSTAAILGLYTLGVRWADRGEHRRFRGAVSQASDASFGVFLAHPLFLQVLLAGAAVVVRPAAAGRIPSAVVLPLDFLVVVPLLYLSAACLVRVLRRTSLSATLTGRSRQAATATPRR